MGPECSRGTRGLGIQLTPGLPTGVELLEEFIVGVTVAKIDETLCWLPRKLEVATMDESP